MIKTISRALPLFFLTAVALTSCSGLTATSTINPTDVSDTAIAVFKTEIAATLTAAPTNMPTFSQLTPSSIPPTQTPSYDRHDPEAVIRAWFDAWQRRDGHMMDLLRGTDTNGHYAFEPTDSIKILEIKLESSPSEAKRIYQVWYDIQYTNPNMGSGKKQWRFYLTWDSNRDAWIITNYGHT
mgnify:CR=1 FL=1